MDRAVVVERKGRLSTKGAKGWSRWLLKGEGLRSVMSGAETQSSRIRESRNERTRALGKRSCTSM